MNALSAYEKFKEKLVANIDVQRGQCWFLHPWGRWGDARQMNITRADTKGVVGEVVTQFRHCTRCGKLDMQQKEWKLKL
jgi:hypothetical protein